MSDARPQETSMPANKRRKLGDVDDGHVGFLDRCDELRTALFDGAPHDKPYDKTLGWTFAVGSKEAYSHLGNHGYIKAAEKDGELVLYRLLGDTVDLAFRGTALASQWFSKAGNCNLEKTPLKWAKDCKGHIAGGFGEAYELLRPHLEEVYARLHHCKRVRVMGHSRGAALAQLAGLDISCNFFQGPVDVVVFAGPRVGDADFKDFYHSRKNVQVVNFELASDPVPKMPLATLDDSALSKIIVAMGKASLVPGAKEAIGAGFEHVVKPVCLDEHWAEPVAIEVVAGVIAGEPSRVHSIQAYQTAYKRFFMDLVELSRDHRPALLDATMQRILTTFVACRENATLRQLDDVKRQNQNTHEMLANLKTAVDRSVEDIGQGIARIEQFLENDQRAGLQGSLLCLKAQAMSPKVDDKVKESVRRNSEEAMKMCVRIAICNAATEEVITVLLKAMGEVTRAQIITGLAFEDSFSDHVQVYFDFFKPILNTVIDKVVSAKAQQDNSEILCAWEFLYRQLSTIAMFQDQASELRLKLHNSMTARQQDIHFVTEREGYENALASLNRDMELCVANAVQVLKSDMVLRAVLPAEKQSQIERILKTFEVRTEDLQKQLAELAKKASVPTIMIAGRISVGKTTFVKALLQAYTGEVISLPSSAFENTHAVTILELMSDAPPGPGVLAEILPEDSNKDSVPMQVTNWANVKNALKERIDKEFLDAKKARNGGSRDAEVPGSDAVLVDKPAEGDAIPVVKIRVYGCTGTLTVIDTPGSEGIGCDYTDFLAGQLVIPVFLCSFEQPTLFDASNLKVLDFMADFHSHSVMPPSFIFTRHSESKHRKKPEEEEEDEPTADAAEEQYESEKKAINKLAELVKERGLQKPVVGAPNALAAISKKNPNHAKAKEDIRSLCKVFEHLGNLFQPLMAHGRTLKVVQKTLIEAVNEVFEDDMSHAVFGDEEEFKRFQKRVTEDIMNYVDNYVDFLKGARTRDELARRMATDAGCPGAYRAIIRMEGLVLERQKNNDTSSLPVAGRSKRDFVDKVLQLMSNSFQQRLQADVSGKAAQLLAQHMDSFIKPSAMRDHLKAELSMTLPSALATGLLCGGLAGGSVVGGLWLWFEAGAISLGPPGMIAAAVVGASALGLAGSTEIWLWSTKGAVKQCTDSVLKSLHDRREKMKDEMKKSCRASLEILFGGLRKLREPGEDDFRDSMENVANIKIRMKQFTAELTHRLKSVHLVVPGDDAPTKVLKDSLMDNGQAW
eukprot:TRINITY_DN11514_c0_g3_i2.p1 TRINITY_DN11514_c0_g3~~TRINITY_DN11514_c0_g3_i2.p1  ORF type:complete len:1275 (-),score=212.21 TRINITY_DN11514_c0_g3_i2:360-4103(-)